MLWLCRSLCSDLWRPQALWAEWISVKQTGCTSQGASKIIHFYVVHLSNCHWLLYPVRHKLFSARFFSLALWVFNILRPVLLLGFHCDRLCGALGILSFLVCHTYWNIYKDKVYDGWYMGYQLWQVVIVDKPLVSFSLLFICPLFSAGLAETYFYFQRNLERCIQLYENVSSCFN